MESNWKQTIEDQIEELALSDGDDITLDYEQVVQSWIDGKIGVYQIPPKQVLEFIDKEFPFAEDCLPAKLEVKLVKAQLKEGATSAKAMIQICFGAYLSNSSDTFDQTTHEFVKDVMIHCQTCDNELYQLIWQTYPELDSSTVA